MLLKMHLIAPNLRKFSINVKIFLLPRFWLDVFSCCVSNITVGRSQEAGGCLDLSQSAIHENRAGGKGTLSNREEHAEPWQLHHQQRLFPDFHSGLLNKTDPEWWVHRAAPHSRIGICVLALLPSPSPFHGSGWWLFATRSWIKLCGWVCEPSSLFSLFCSRAVHVWGNVGFWG